MKLRNIAAALGRRGGRARAKCLSRDERKRIAALGGRARRQSFQAGRRIEENFRYVETLQVLSRVPKAVSASSWKARLPGLYG